MTQAPHDSSVCELWVDGRPLPQDYTKAVSGVGLRTSIDAAGQLDITVGINDAGKGFRILDERVLFPGVEVEVRAGYGKRLIPKGRYTIKDHRVSYTGGSATIKAFDSLADLLKGTDALLFEGYSRNSDVIEAMLERNYPTWGWVLQPSPERKNADSFKAVGDTDLMFLKAMAEGDGWAYPRVWSREQYEFAAERLRQSGSPIAQLLFSASTNLRDKNLVYLPVSDLYAFSPSLKLWHKTGKDKGGDFSELNVNFSSQDMPTGIEVYGMQADADGVQRAVKVVVEFSQEGPKVLGTTPNFDTKWTRQEKIRDKIGSGGTLAVYALGEGRRSVETGGKYTYTNEHGVEVTGKSEKSESEVLYAMTIETEQDAEAYALEWFRLRSSAYLMGTFGMTNLPGTAELDAQQVHEIHGIAGPHVGPYIITDCVHNWSRGGGHAVSGNVQRLVDEGDLPPKNTALLVETEHIEGIGM
jgi:hypothetical protein